MRVHWIALPCGLAGDGVTGKLHKIALFPVCSVESSVVFPGDGRDSLNGARLLGRGAVRFSVNEAVHETVPRSFTEDTKDILSCYLRLLRLLCRDRSRVMIKNSSEADT
jgi:hypothetical protein